MWENGWAKSVKTQEYGIETKWFLRKWVRIIRKSLFQLQVDLKLPWQVVGDNIIGHMLNPEIWLSLECFETPQDLEFVF